MLGIIFKVLFPFFYATLCKLSLFPVSLTYLLIFFFNFCCLFSLVSLKDVSCPFSVVIFKGNKRLIQDLGK